MNPVTRRIFLKPSGYTEEQIKRFGELLSAALRRQKTLSEQSPYILSPTGELIESERAFEFAHEPARGLAIPELFDPEAPARSIDDLNRACSALVYGLRAAHSSGPIIHGGICPGVLVVDPSGLWKLTDFGFAPAVLAAFESDAFLQLAVGPSAAYPDASAVWEITPDPEEPRDERLWSFVDPNRYAQALQTGRRQPARFDPISDVISAGFVLYILADKIHPYLKSIDAAEEFRIASYWDMLPTGRPRGILRKDVFTDPNSPLHDWWKNFVPKAIEREPVARKTIEELAVRLITFSPPIDAEQLLAARRAAEAVRWIAALEASVERADWVSVEQQLGTPPVFVPSEGLVRVAAAREALDAHQKAQAEIHRQHLERADWSAWLDSIQTHVDVEQWDPAAEELKQRRDRGLAACPETLRERWQSLTAMVRAGREDRDIRLQLAARTDRANAWLVEMREAADSVDVARIEALGKAAPDTTGCDAELIEAVGERARWANDLRGAIAADLAATNDWFAKAEAEAGARRWDVALDMLDQLPELAFPPDDLAARIERLRTVWQQRLESLGDERRAAAESLVHGLVAECARGRLADFVQPEAFDTAVRGTNEDDKDGKITTTVDFTVGWSNATGPDADLGQFTCTIGFDGVEPRLLSNAADITGQIASALAAGIADRQRRALLQWIQSLKGTFLGEAKCDGVINAPVAKKSVTLEWTRAAVSASTAVSLEWDLRAFAWRPTQDPSPLERLVAQAAAHAKSAIEQTLAEKAPGFDRCRPLLEITPPQLPTLNWDRLPAALQFNTPVGIRPPGAQPEPLVTAQVAMPSPVRADIALDVRALKATLEALLLKRRKASIEALGAEIQARIKKTPVAIKSGPDPRAAAESAIWTLAAKGIEPHGLVAQWRGDTLAFALPADWQKQIDEQVKLATAKPVKEPPPPEKPEKAAAKSEPPPAAPPKPAPSAPSAPAPPATPAAAPLGPVEHKPTVAEKKPAKPAAPAQEKTPPIVSASDKVPASPPPKRRGHLVIAAAAIIVIGGGSILWYANRPIPAPIPTPSPRPSPIPDQREIDRVIAEFDKWKNAATAVRDDAWYTTLAQSLESMPPRPQGMDAADYDRRLEELRAIQRARPITPPPDPRIAVWRSDLTEARRLLDASDPDKAKTTIAGLPRNELPNELLSEFTALESSIASAIARRTAPTQPVPLPIQPTWPAAWAANPTLVRVVSDLLGDLWSNDYAAAMPQQTVATQNDMTMSTDGEFTIKLRDNGMRIPELAGTIKVGDKSPVLNKTSRDALANWVADRTLSEIVRKHVAQGKFAAAIGWKERLKTDKLFASTPLNAALRTNIDAVAASIPDAWKPRAGFTAGPLDSITGYPSTLTQSAPGARKFDLVWTFSGDDNYRQLFDAVTTSADPGHVALTNALGGELKPENLGLRIYYVETTASNSPPASSGDAPTLSEWFLAAGKSRSVRDGVKTWCQGGWACGSAELNLAGKAVRIPELPRGETAGDIAAWLANPLTCQMRDPDDKNLSPPIAGYRSVIRMWPKP